MMTRSDTDRTAMADVAVVGYGPVGATLANLLAGYGLSVVVFEREGSVYHQPRAGHFDGEVARVFQAAGVGDAVVAKTVLNRGMQFLNAEGALILDWPRPQEIGPEGWHPSYRFHQPTLELTLRAKADERPGLTVLLRHEVLTIEERGDHVELLARHLPDGTERRVRARYVVGSDGARSTVRKAMGVALEDLKSHEQWLIVDVILKGEDRLPTPTIQLCDPKRPVTMGKMGQRRRWEMMLMPGETAEDMVRPETYWALLDRWLKPDEAEVERAVVYTFHSVIAETWRRGRMMLAGDSCHQTPPFMGQGMCAGIRDAANLSWKLAAVVRGEAPETLLDTYGSERIPNVRVFIETAVRLGGLIHVTDPVKAAERDAMLRSNPQAMKTPAPPIGPGWLWAGSPHAGTRARQLVLADGRRSDDAVGPGFGLFLRADLLASLPAVPGLAVLTDADPAVADWLDALGVAAVLVRPDRAIAGTAGDAGALAELVTFARLDGVAA